MSHDLEEDLQRRLHAQVDGLELAPGAVGAVTEKGRRRARRRRRAISAGVLAVAAVGAIAVAGWPSGADDAPDVVATNEHTPSTPPEQPPPPAPQLMARDADDPFPGLYAHLSGTLVVTADSCIAVMPDSAQVPLAVLWGHGWSADWQDGQAVVYDADGNIFAWEGDRIGLGGGGVNSSDSSTSRYAGRPCWADTVWVANDTQAPQTHTHRVEVPLERFR